MITREQAEEVVHGLGIALYLREGRLFQHGPGERIEPRAGALPQPHSPMEAREGSK